MKFITSITKVGGSYYFKVDKNVFNLLSLKNKDLIEVDVEKCFKIITYRCRGCSHIFDTDDVNPYCPSCDDSSLEIIEVEE